jgi:hypothetical protein
MGGLGSGGWGIWGSRRKKHRRTVESCLVLDVNHLSKRGYLQPGGGLGTFPLALGNTVVRRTKIRSPISIETL